MSKIVLVIKQKVEINTMAALKGSFEAVGKIFYIAQCYRQATQTATYHYTTFKGGMERVRKDPKDREGWMTVACYVGAIGATTFVVLRVSTAFGGSTAFAAAWYVAQVQGSAKACQDLRKQAGDLAEELRLLRAQSTGQISSLQEAQTNLEKQKEELTKKNEELTRKIAELETEQPQALEKQKAESNEEIENLKRQNAELSQEIEKLRKTIEELHREREELRMKVLELEEKQEKLKEQIAQKEAELRREIERIIEQNKKEKGDLEKITRRIEGAARQTDRNIRGISSLTPGMPTGQETVEKLLRDGDALRKANIQLMQINDKFHEKIRECHVKIQKLTSKNEELTREVSKYTIPKSRV